VSDHVPGRLTKNQRQHRITKLLEEQPVTSQAQLVALLADQGVEATQTTVSRDLDDLGAVKVRLPGGETAYALPELPVRQIAPEDHLRRVLGEWVAHRPGPPTSSGRPWTAAASRRSWALWPETTRCWWWSTSGSGAPSWRHACATSRALPRRTGSR